MVARRTPAAQTPPADQLSRWGRTYVVGVSLLGVGAIAQSAYTLYAEPIGWNWFVLAVLTLISGSATVKLPSVPATISVSETFVFTSVLLFGSAAGTITVALDALVISLWLARRGHPFYRIAFNVCALPASLWLGAHLFYWIWGRAPLSLASSPVAIRGLIEPLLAFTVVYYLLNSWFIALAISLENRLPPLAVWRNNFAWLSLNYFGGASVAALLVSYTRNIDYAYLAFVLPLLAVLYFTFSTSLGRVEDANRHLVELNRLYMSTIETLAMAIDAKDQITHGHIRRVQGYAVGLAKTLGVTDPAQISAIEAASLLHDMGKLAVPEYILNKPGPLTPAEFEKMKLHASVGADILSSIEFPYPVVPIVRHHHENWNGTGYPDGISGSEIPLGARILSVVDCFDALTSDRPYRPRLSDAQAVEILIQRRGTMYDPLIVDTFVHTHALLAPKFENVTDQPPALSHSAFSVGQASTTSLEDITASAEETVVLYNLASALSASSDESHTLETMTQHLRRVIPVSTCVLYVYDPHTDLLRVAHAVGEAASQFFGITIPRGQRLSGWVAANRQTIVNSDPALDLGDSGRLAKPRLRSCLSTPLMTDGELVGVLTLYSVEPAAFTEDHRRVIEGVAVHSAFALARSAEIENKREHADTATPTAFLSEQLLETRLESLLSQGPHATTPVVFIKLHGASLASMHNSSELHEACRIVRELTGADHLFGYRGDEIVVLLPKTDPSSALAVATNLGGALARLFIAGSAENTVTPQVELRMAVAPSDGVLLSELARASLSQRLLGPATPGTETGSVH